MSGMPDDVTTRELAARVVRLLIDKNMTLATAESCTGGLLAAYITTVPGVSAVYAGGFVTYTVKTKKSMLGVSARLLQEKGAVSKKTAKQMAEKAAEQTGADIAVSVTGNAGPDPSEGKPVGLVFIGFSIDGKVTGRKLMLSGNRDEIREQVCRNALQHLYRKLAPRAAGKEDAQVSFSFRE